jgi:DNA-binding response OmpR family regulator
MEHTRSLGRVLLVDDDLLLRKVVRLVLGESGYDVVAVENAAAAEGVLDREEVHLIILDVAMPGMSGPDFCRQIRARGAMQPVLFLSGHKELPDKMTGFAAGGDDYLAKPFDPRELLVRVQALLNRQFWGTANPVRNVVHAGGLTLDVLAMSVRLPSGRLVSLAPTELRILRYLMDNAGHVVTRDLILQAGWGYNYDSASNQVDVYIRRIRRKLEGSDNAVAIQTVRGVGYRLVLGVHLAHVAGPRL